MSRIPRIDDLGSIIRDIRIRLERLERGKAIVGGSGGTGIPNPSTSVVSETAYGQAASAGTDATQFSLGSHTHGSPARELPAGGSTSQVLSKNSATDYDVGWATAGGGGMTNPMTTKGDIILADTGGTPVRLGLGSVGQVPTVSPVGGFFAQMLNDGPVVYYRLNDASALVGMVDSSGNGTSGAYSSSGVTYHVAPATGDGDYAVTFNGTAGYAHVGSNPIGSGDFSLVFFVKTSATTVQQMAIGTHNGSFSTPPNQTWGFFPYGVAATGLTHPTFYCVGSSGNSGYLYAAGTTITDGNWHMIVITRTLSSGLVTMYIDGTAVALTGADALAGSTGVAFATLTLNGGSDMYLGANAAATPTTFWAGSEDEAAVFHSVLTSAQVTALWNAVPATASNSLAYKTPAPAGILGSKSYQAAADYSTTSGTVVDIDATNLAITFTCPASGNVLVTMSGMGYNSGGNTTYFAVRSGTTQMGSLAAVGNLSTPCTYCGRVLVTGLTAGASYTFKWAWKVSAGTANLFSDATQGPVVMTVEAA